MDFNPAPWLIGLCVFSCQPAFATDLFSDQPPLPEVLTATRLKQAPAQVPGSLTVLDRELIEASGARDIPELLRLVPGMMVGYNHAAYQSTVNYHGGRQGEARRLQVLIDGRSVYRPGLATVDWSDLPVAFEDIERIEVFRGPNTVSYGANAMMGVINITTRHPALSQGSTLKYTRGQRGVSDWYASQGLHWANADARISLSGVSDDGFDVTDLGDHYRDSRRNSRMQLSVSHMLDNGTFDWQIAASQALNQRGFYDNDTLFKGYGDIVDNGKDISAKDYAASFNWSFNANDAHSISISSAMQRWEREQDWRQCDVLLAFDQDVSQMYQHDPLGLEYVSNLLRKGRPQSVEKYIADGMIKAEQAHLARSIRDKFTDPSGTYLRSICGNTDKNIRENRFDLELLDTWIASDALRFVSGVAFRYDQSHSDTLFQGAVDNRIWRFFSHGEWYLTKHLLLQGGFMHERDELSGNSTTPRVALNYLFNPRHSLRFVYSEAIRSPDMFEAKANWRLPLNQLSEPIDGKLNTYWYPSAKGVKSLKQEISRSREIGYNGQFTQGLSLDIKVFEDDIRRMISEPLTIDDFEPSNNNWMWFRGIEGQADWRINPSDRLRISYSKLKFAASQKIDRRLPALRSGSAGWMHQWGAGWSSSVFYYGADLLNERRFERADVRIAKEFVFKRSTLQLAALLQQRLDDEPLTWVENIYSDRQQWSFTAQLEF